MIDIPDTVRFTSPESFLVVLPLLLLLVHQMFFGQRTGAIGFSGLEYLRARKIAVGTWRRVVRAALSCLVVVGLGLLWAEPVYFGSKPLLTRDSRANYKTFIVAFDMSPSMNLPAESKGFGGEDLKVGDDGVTRYEMARNALFDFLERFRGERFGLILFSTEPFFARWPTVETEGNFVEVLEDIRRGAGTQLEAFSSLTNTDKALKMAGNALQGEEGAVILISDAEDDLENLGNAVRALRGAGIRLYTIGVGIPDQVITQLAEEFILDPGFRIFRVDSEADMREAYHLVGEVEESPQFSGENRIFKSELRWLLALMLIAFASIVFWVNESFFHVSVSSRYKRGQGQEHGV